jgi:hypothetical protein
MRRINHIQQTVYNSDVFIGSRDFKLILAGNQRSCARQYRCEASKIIHSKPIKLKFRTDSKDKTFALRKDKRKTASGIAREDEKLIIFM